MNKIPFEVEAMNVEYVEDKYIVSKKDNTDNIVIDKYGELVLGIGIADQVTVMAVSKSKDEVDSIKINIKHEEDRDLFPRYSMLGFFMTAEKYNDLRLKMIEIESNSLSKRNLCRDVESLEYADAKLLARAFIYKSESVEDMDSKTKAWEIISELSRVIQEKEVNELE